jgi:hypothetical protein
LEKFKFKEFGIGLNLEKCFNIFELKIPIIIYLISFPYLQFRIVPSIDIKACVQLGLEFSMDKNNSKLNTEMNFVIDCYLNAIASVSLEIGIYCPPFSTGFEISFSIGIKGILDSRKIGVKDFSNLLNNNKTRQ